MDRLIGLFVLGLLLVAVPACSKAPQTAESATQATAAAHVDPPPPGMPDKDALPDKTVSAFLKAAQTGDKPLLSALSLDRRPGRNRQEQHHLSTRFVPEFEIRGGEIRICHAGERRRPRRLRLDRPRRKGERIQARRDLGSAKGRSGMANRRDDHAAVPRQRSGRVQLRRHSVAGGSEDFHPNGIASAAKRKRSEQAAPKKPDGTCRHAKPLTANSADQPEGRRAARGDEAAARRRGDAEVVGAQYGERRSICDRTTHRAERVRLQRQC